MDTNNQTVDSAELPLEAGANEAEPAGDEHAATAKMGFKVFWGHAVSTAGLARKTAMWFLIGRRATRGQ